MFINFFTLFWHGRCIEVYFNLVWNVKDKHYLYMYGIKSVWYENNKLTGSIFN